MKRILFLIILTALAATPCKLAAQVGAARRAIAVGVNGGVVLNSLDPDDPLYREDLVKSLYAVGSLF